MGSSPYDQIPRVVDQTQTRKRRRRNDSLSVAETLKRLKPDQPPKAPAKGSRKGCMKGKGGPENKSCKYRGVRQRIWGKWVAEIRMPTTIGGKRLWLGSFANAYEAALAYDEAARVMYGDNAILNLPHVPSSDQLVESTEVPYMDFTGYDSTNTFDNFRNTVEYVPEVPYMGFPGYESMNTINTSGNYTVGYGDKAIETQTDINLWALPADFQDPWTSTQSLEDEGKQVEDEDFNWIEEIDRVDRESNTNSMNSRDNNVTQSSEKPVEDDLDYWLVNELNFV